MVSRLEFPSSSKSRIYVVELIVELTRANRRLLGFER